MNLTSVADPPVSKIYNPNLKHFLAFPGQAVRLLLYFSYLQMFLSKHDINHNVRERRTKQRLKLLLQTSLPPPSSPLSGSPRTEGRSWRCRPDWLASKYSPLILWFMYRKQETIHREQSCYWSLDSVHTRRLNHTQSGRFAMPSSGRPALLFQYVD